MRKIIKLGNSSNPNNDIKINDKTVSYEHLEIIWLGDGKIKLKNLSNTNHTVVNDFVIRESAVIQPTDTIMIGQTSYKGKELIRQAATFVNKDRLTFYEEFKQLKPAFTAYRNEVKSTRSNHKNKVALVRFGVPFLLIVLFIAFGKSMGLAPDIRIVISLVGSSLAVVLADKVFDEEKLKDSLKDVEMKYAPQLRCPKCTYSLKKEPYRYWLHERRCPKCKANWVR
jgi:predicted Zn-ribbon and HTH transcriptional regulator